MSKGELPANPAVGLVQFVESGGNHLNGGLKTGHQWVVGNVGYGLAVGRGLQGFDGTIDGLVQIGLFVLLVFDESGGVRSGR